MPRILINTTKYNTLVEQIQNLKEELEQLQEKLEKTGAKIPDKEPPFLIPFRLDKSESHSTKAVYEGPGGAIIFVELPLGDKWDLLKHLNSVCSGRIE